MRKKKGKAFFLASFAALENAVSAAEYGRAASSDNLALHQRQSFRQAPQITYKSKQAAIFTIGSRLREVAQLPAEKPDYSAAIGCSIAIKNMP